MQMLGSPFRLPSGARAVRLDCIGTITQEDAEGWIQQVGPGGPYDGLSVLAVTVQIDSIGPDARSVFSRRGNPKAKRWMAVVVTSPMIRVTTNFLVRITGTKTLRLFDTEGEAMLWLDARLREDAAKKAAP